MQSRSGRLLITLTLALGLTLALLWLLSSGPVPATAAPVAELHVCLSGCAYSSVQTAVDAAGDGDVVKVAAGTYTDVHQRNGITQVVCISKTITIQGGYTTTNWATSDPNTYTTTLNAQGQGRVLYITGDISPIIEGLRITGGNATGLGGSSFGDAGGGVYVMTATATISGSKVLSNSAGYGSGLYLYRSEAKLQANTIASNIASQVGGGVFMREGAPILSDNTIGANVAAWYGGGVFVWSGDAALRGNIVISNTATDGGGIYLNYSSATLSGNVAEANTATADGGGLYVYASDATLVNNVIIDNQAHSNGSGVYIAGSAPQMLHTTIARNAGGDGSGVYITNDPYNHVESNVALTNTLLVSHTVGISVTSNQTAIVNGALWHNTPITISQATTATISVWNQYEDDPAFDADGYHIIADSAAINKGVDAGVDDDIDGEVRDAVPDLGADEYRACWARVNDGATDYITVQAAVDAASEGDTVKVAGYCVGVNIRPRNDITTTGTVTQVVYISKTITIQGGYTTDNWTSPDPDANSTTLDAEGQGRVLYITGDISLTIEGLHITGGDSTGLGGFFWEADAGGGMFVYTAAVTIRNCVIYGNTASVVREAFGGGLYLLRSDATLVGNAIVSNTASTADIGRGGGIQLLNSDATVRGNTIQGNTASTGVTGFGGGVHAWSSDATVSNNLVQDNIASTARSGYGGGLYLLRGDVSLVGNTIISNTASTADLGLASWGGWGGGVCLDESGATLRRNVIISNTASLSATATGKGGGLYVWGSSPYAFTPFTLTNNLVAGNHANTAGGGLSLEGRPYMLTSGHLCHNTIADNRGGGGGVAVGEYATVSFVNTIIAGHAGVGITVTAGSTATLEGTLWYGNGVNAAGDGEIFTGTVNVVGDPFFVNPATGDYHLGASSAAIDKGVDAGVIGDIDGEARSFGAGPDLGADEWATTETVVEPASAAILSATVGGLTTTVEVPSQAVTEAITLKYTALATTAHGNPTGFAFAGHAFDLDAYQGETLLTGFVFSKPVTITIHYDEGDIGGVNEDTLVLEYWNGSEWIDTACGDYDRHPADDWLAVPICHLSRFALFGEQRKVYLPLVIRND